MKLNIQLKRVYDPANGQDGFRVLVDRFWPRGMSKEKVKADLWLKNSAPSPDLINWFEHDPAKWANFKERYFAELDENPEAIQTIVEKAQNGTVTLLYSARDTEHNQAVVLKEYLLNRI